MSNTSTELRQLNKNVVNAFIPYIKHYIQEMNKQNVNITEEQIRNQTIYLLSRILDGCFCESDEWWDTKMTILKNVGITYDDECDAKSTFGDMISSLRYIYD
jgi:hypothetical protein